MGPGEQQLLDRPGVRVFAGNGHPGNDQITCGQHIGANPTGERIEYRCRTGPREAPHGARGQDRNRPGIGIDRRCHRRPTGRVVHRRNLAHTPTPSQAALGPAPDSRPPPPLPVAASVAALAPCPHRRVCIRVPPARPTSVRRAARPGRVRHRPPPVARADLGRSQGQPGPSRTPPLVSAAALPRAGAPQSVVRSPPWRVVRRRMPLRKALSAS